MPPARCRSVATNRPPGLRSASSRHLAADPIEVVDGQRQARLARDGQQVQHGVGRAAAGERRPRSRFRSTARVMICFGVRLRLAAGPSRAGPAWRPTSAFAGSVAGTEPLPIGAMPRNSIAIAIVFAVNWPPQAPAPGHAWSSRSFSSRVGHLAGRVRADALVDVLNRDVVALEASRRDRPAVEHQARHAQPRHRHRRARDRLVAAAERDDGVEAVAARDQLDRVRDDLAADERWPACRGCPS